MDFATTVIYSGEYPSRIECQNGAMLDYAYPVEFGGKQGFVTPEDAFIGSANMCFQIVFRTVASSLGMTVQSYRCRAVGDLQTVDGVRKYVRIVLYPEIRFAEGSKVDKLDKAIEATKRRCLVTNSMTCDIVVEPKIV
jgi:organic hydroperoxide reductase OsmC/OhrA